jgi:hypothetical protein
MGVETKPSEFDNLKTQGKLLGLHVERHKSFDTTREGSGDLYVQQRKAIFQFETGGTGNPPSLIRYATAEQVRSFLFEREAKVDPF